MMKSLLFLLIAVLLLVCALQSAADQPLPLHSGAHITFKGIQADGSCSVKTTTLDAKQTNHYVVQCAPGVTLPPGFMYDGVYWTLRAMQHDLVCAGEEHDAGCTSCKAHLVELDTADDSAQVVLLHELMHVVSACDSLDEDILHEHIYELSPGLVSLLHSNPALSRYILQ